MLSRLQRWWHASTSARRSRRPARRPYRPRLEGLEDRLVPATLVFGVPATFTVNTTLDVENDNDGKRSRREAITEANNHFGADTIVLPAGLYTMTRTGAGDNANRSGDFDITDSVTIRG